GIDFNQDLRNFIDYLVNIEDGFDFKTKIAITEFLSEIQEIYTKIINIISPFDELNSLDTFNTKFKFRYNNFLGEYKKNRIDIDYHCSQVKKLEEYIIKNNQINIEKKRNLWNRLFNKDSDMNQIYLKEIINIITNWNTHHVLIHNQFMKLPEHLFDELSKVNSIVEKGNINSAYIQLKMIMESNRYRLDDIQNLLHSIEDILYKL
ncbi:MAG: hypothetical protein R3321_11130, partial [Nitrososphaeraceae archaeon]|nr:hypothetical protein [Nitrososphaeraceae archaeon]